MKHPWRIHLQNLEATIGVGIHQHELTKQRVLVNVIVEGNYPARPESIRDCFNYEYIYELVTKEWPEKPHKPLLEDCAIELLEHIFRYDERVENATVKVCKPDIFSHAEAVGVETTWARNDYNKFSNLKE